MVSKIAKKVSAKSIASGKYKQLMKSVREAKADPERLTSKAKLAAVEGAQKANRAIKNISTSDIDRAAGRTAEAAGKELSAAKDKVIETAKKVGKATRTTVRNAKKAGSWIANNPIKTAAGVGAVASGAAAMSDDDDLSGEIKKIKAKDPSERTAAEKRLLRIMEEE